MHVRPWTVHSQRIRGGVSQRVVSGQSLPQVKAPCPLYCTFDSALRKYSRNPSISRNKRLFHLDSLVPFDTTCRVPVHREAARHY